MKTLLNNNLILIILLVSSFYGSSLTVLGIKKNSKYNSFNRIYDKKATSDNHNGRNRLTLTASASDINNNNKDSSITTGAVKPPYEFCNKELDAKILKLALPAVLNFAIVPLVGAVDTYWVSVREC